MRRCIIVWIQDLRRQVIHSGLDGVTNSEAGLTCMRLAFWCSSLSRYVTGLISSLQIQPLLSSKIAA